MFSCRCVWANRWLLRTCATDQQQSDLSCSSASQALCRVRGYEAATCTTCGTIVPYEGTCCSGGSNQAAALGPTLLITLPSINTDAASSFTLQWLMKVKQAPPAAGSGLFIIGNTPGGNLPGWRAYAEDGRILYAATDA